MGLGGLVILIGALPRLTSYGLENTEQLVSQIKNEI